MSFHESETETGELTVAATSPVRLRTRCELSSSQVSEVFFYDSVDLSRPTVYNILGHMKVYTPSKRQRWGNRLGGRPDRRYQGYSSVFRRVLQSFGHAESAEDKSIREALSTASGFNAMRVASTRTALAFIGGRQGSPIHAM